MEENHSFNLNLKLHKETHLKNFKKSLLINKKRLYIYNKEHVYIQYSKCTTTDITKKPIHT